MQVPILLYISIAVIVVCVTGRRRAIGGWLLYFYYWILLVLSNSLLGITRHLNVFRPSFGSGSVNHEALVLAIFPRLLVYSVVAAIGVVLLVRREWAWIERLRVALIAGVVIAGLSVWLDVLYFPNLRGSTLSGGLVFVFGWAIFLFPSACTVSSELTIGTNSIVSIVR